MGSAATQIPQPLVRTAVSVQIWDSVFAPPTKIARAVALTAACLALVATAAQAGAGWSFKPPAKDGPAAKFFESGGWEEQRGSWDSWRFRNGALHTYQDDDSTLVGRKVSIDPKATPILRFSFEVKQHPRGADLRRKDTEDSALRIFVVFDRGGGLFSPPDSIAYAFGNPAIKGRAITSERFDNVKYMVVAGGRAQLGRRIEIERNLAKDYRRAFGRAAPRIQAIGIKSDSNNLDAKAQAIVHGIAVTAR